MSATDGVRTSERATITVKDASAFLGVDPRTLSGALSVHGGDIPSLSIGRRIVIPRAAFLRWYDGGADNAQADESPTPEQQSAGIDPAVVRAKLIELLGALEGAS